MKGRREHRHDWGKRICNRQRADVAHPSVAPEKQTGADCVPPELAAAYLDLSERDLFALWQSGLGPPPVYFRCDVRFRVADLERFLELERSDPLQRKRRLEIVARAAQQRPLWHRTAGQIKSLQQKSPNAPGDRAAAYQYLSVVYDAVNDIDDRMQDFQELRSLFSDLMRRTSLLSKASISRNSRALAFCYLEDVSSYDLRAHIGKIKAFVTKREAAAAALSPAPITAWRLRRKEKE